MVQRPEAPNQPDTVQLENSQGVVGAAQQLTKLQDHFLDRLQHFLKRKAEVQQVPRSDSRILKALDKAVYSTYLDCVEQGLGEDAKALLKLKEKQAQV